MTERRRVRLSDLDGQTEPIQGLPVADLLDGWCGEVARFYRELDQSWGDDRVDVWGVDDLVGAYHLRARVETALGEFHGLEPPHSVQLADTVLRGFTHEVAADWWKPTGHTPGPGWWWRAPTRGPAAEQVAEF